MACDGAGTGVFPIFSPENRGIKIERQGHDSGQRDKRRRRLCRLTIFFENALLALQKTETLLACDQSLDEGRLTRPTKSGRIRLVIGETEGTRLEGRHREILLRHEGLAPVRVKGSKPVRASKRT